MPADISLILPLAQARRSAKTGSKAVNLSSLIAARFAVPRGFVIGADAYRSHLWTTGLREVAGGSPEAEDRERIRAAILGLDIPADIWTAIAASYQHLSWQSGLPEPKVAVRSSALEDGGVRRAFPGAYESYLNVRGLDDLRAVVKRVWASVWNGRAAGCRAALGVDGEPAMAVIVQEMVEASVSGVSMTANPVTGDPNRALISWTREPEETERCEIDLADMSSPECASEPLVQFVAEQSVLIEEVFGARIEVEWAHDGERLWLLQAQPIADLPAHFPVEWSNDGEAALEWRKATAFPVSPLSRGILWGETRKRAGGFAAQRAADKSRLVNGYLYRHRAPLDDSDSNADAARVQAREISLGSRLLSEWNSEVLPNLLARSDRIIGLDPPKMDHLELTRVLTEAAELARAAAERLDETWYPAMRFPKLLRDFLGSGTDGECLYQRLIGGIEHPIIMRDARLQELGERFAIAERSGKLDDGKWWRGYRDDVQAFARRYGYAFADAGEMCDLAAWTSWAEDPDVVFRIIGALSRLGSARLLPSLVTLHCAGEQDAQSARAEAEDIYEGRARRHFSELLELSKGWLAARGDAVQACALAFAATRLVLMEIAGRLCRTGALASRDAIFHVTLDELLSLPAEPTPEDRKKLSATVARRKHELWLESRLAAPEALSQESHPEAESNVVPPLPRRGLGGGPVPEGALQGRPSAPGVATGRARVAANVADAGEIEKGDILIVRSPSPAWTPFFALAGAFVCEEEDEACISEIAQEYGLPAVVGCAGAMASGLGGRRITVDGAAGVVHTYPVSDTPRLWAGVAKSATSP